jgi:hypothetical protein
MSERFVIPRAKAVWRPDRFASFRRIAVCASDPNHSADRKALWRADPAAMQRALFSGWKHMICGRMTFHISEQAN